MYCYGLTGGIASGKSTVAAMFRALGAHIIDADEVYHSLIQPGPSPDHRPSPLAQRINSEFPGTLRADGTLDRPALASVVFGDPAKRRALELITHPAVAQEVAARIATLHAAGVERVLYDVPLLYERGLEQGMHGVIVVWVPHDLQRQRLQQRDGFSDTDAERRLAAQLPLDEKRKRADWVIDNSGPLDATRQQVEHIWRILKQHQLP